MKIKPTLLLGVALILVGLFIGNAKKVDNKLKLLEIDQPSADIISLVAPIGSLVTNPDDKAKMALFNFEFSKRISSYDADIQQVNDVYVLAAQKFFQDSMDDKYNNLDVKIVDLIRSVTSEENHTLTDAEKLALSQRFSGLSWTLINK
jgi:hypothetical protein